MRKYSPDSSDPYLDPNTGILRNLVGAVTEERLELLEGTLVSARAYELTLGLRPPVSPTPAALSHLDCRAFSP